MRRRSLIIGVTLAPLALFLSRYLKPRKSKTLLPAEYLERAQRLNQFAASIGTIAEARRFVDLVAETFADEASPFLSGALRDRIALAEFLAVTDPQKLIPEQRIAEAWNGYVHTLQAADDQKVSPAEVHNLRDAFLNSARLSWNSGNRQIWTVPAIYATQPSGELAAGSRAVEAIRVLWDLANMPQNLQAARDRVNKGVLASDLFPQSSPPSKTTFRVTVQAFTNPMWTSGKQYIDANGVAVFHHAVRTMLDRTLA